MPPKPFQAVTLVATFVSPGVAAGAAGFVIVNGKIKRVEPRGPAFLKLTELVKEMSEKVK
jgi:hypothetical protein